MKKYMSGNLVKYRGIIYKVNTSTSEYVALEDVFETMPEKSGEYIEYYKNLEDSEIEDIPLSDEFFINNGYRFDKNTELFTAGDGFGPAIRKRTLDCYFGSDKIEYSVAGIIVKTVDEFQNLMNIMHCERIADKVTI